MASESLRTLERHLENPPSQVEREIAVPGPWFHNLHLPGGVQTSRDHPLGLHASDFGSFGDASRTVVARRSSAIGMIRYATGAGSSTSGALCFDVSGTLSPSNLPK